MSCGNRQCDYRGCCDCDVRAQRKMSDGCFMLAIWIIAGTIFLAFLPAWKILHTPARYDQQTGERGFTGTGWLALSLPCGYGAVQLFSFVILAAPCATETTNSVPALLMYGAMMNGLFGVTLGSALLAWLWQNRNALREFLKNGLQPPFSLQRQGSPAVALGIFLLASVVGFYAIYGAANGAWIKVAGDRQKRNAAEAKAKQAMDVEIAKQPSRLGTYQYGNDILTTKAVVYTLSKGENGGNFHLAVKKGHNDSLPAARCDLKATLSRQNILYYDVMDDCKDANLSYVAIDADGVGLTFFFRDSMFSQYHLEKVN